MNEPGFKPFNELNKYFIKKNERARARTQYNLN
jgi:hypothetical protein